MTITSVVPASAHKDEFIRMRRAGHTYREIGAHFGVSHERVRQILAEAGGADAWARTPAAVRRSKEIETISRWLEENGPIQRDALIEHFGITSSHLTTLVAEGLPSHLILMSGRDTTPQFSDSEVADALVRAWAALLEANPKATGLSHVMYERVRRSTDPSAALLVARYGWEEACKTFGVPPGESWRSKDSYKSRWTDEDMLAQVRMYVEVCREDGRRPSYLGYERWQQERPDAPSGTLVRNRMRDAGWTTWPQIVSAAVTV
jgi:Sigma-70, region 4